MQQGIGSHTSEEPLDPAVFAEGKLSAFSRATEVGSALSAVDKDKQEKTMIRMAEMNPIGKVVGEVLRQNRWRAEQDPPRRPLSEKAIRTQSRGLFFEMFALSYLHEIDEPPHPELSNKLLEIVRDPSQMVSELGEMIDSGDIPAGYEADAEQFASKRVKFTRKYTGLQRNNDAIALRTEVDDEGQIKAEVTGTYEMKNYYLTGKESEADVRDQLKKSKKATLETLRDMGRFIPMYLKYKGHTEVPHQVSVTSTKKFTQTLVQPKGMFEHKKESAYFAQTDYREKDWEGYKFEDAPITMAELSEAYSGFEEEVLKALRQIH